MSRLHARGETVGGAPGTERLALAAARMPSLLALQRAAGNRAVTAMVQRQVTRSATTVTAPFDLATQILTGQELGITPPVVNGQEMPVDRGTAAATARALNAPAVTTTETEGRHEARVTAVPDNQVGANVKLPTAPPSTRVADPATASMMLGLAGKPLRHGWIYKSATPGVLDRRQGQTTVVIEGEPNDARFHADIDAHEKHHADDHWAAAQQILEPWDRELARPDLVGAGDSAEQAQANLYLAAGGTREELARRLDEEWVRRNDAFHATKPGRRSDLKASWISEDGSKVHAYWGY